MNEVQVHPLVPLGWCEQAMFRALERVRQTGWNDVIGQYAAVSETLFWIDIVEAQLREKHYPHYTAALDDQPTDVKTLLRGLNWARNRIVHEVDEIRYLLATATSAQTFDADWTWQPLPPRPDGPRPDRDGYAAYQSALVSRSVVDTLLAVTICLGQAMSSVSRGWGVERDPALSH